MQAAIAKVNEVKGGEDPAAIQRAVDDLSRPARRWPSTSTPPRPAPDRRGRRRCRRGAPAATPAGGRRRRGRRKPDDVIDVEFEEKK